MLKISDLKPGDTIQANYGGATREVLSVLEKAIEVRWVDEDNDTHDYWIPAHVACELWEVVR